MKTPPSVPDAAEVNIGCLRAAEAKLRDHDARIAAAADDLKQLRRDRVLIAERVQACIDVLCGRSTPDLFTSVAIPTSKPNEVPVAGDPSGWADLGPPNCQSGPVAATNATEQDAVRSAKLADVHALQTPDLEAVVDWLLNDTETETVGDLWDWIDEDYGGMRHAGIMAMLRKRGPKEYARHAQAFADAVMLFIANGGQRATPPTAVVGGGTSDTPPAGTPKGERIDALGLKLEDLESCFSLAGAEYGEEVKVGKPVAVNGRPHVVTSSTAMGQTYRTFDVLPLYTLAEFGRRHPGVATYSTLTPADPKGRGGREPGEYGGLMVTVGKGGKKEVLVVGLKNEQRRLLWTKVIDPYAAKAKKQTKHKVKS